MVYYVINLARRIDRLEYIKREMDKYNLPFVRFNAIDRKPGWMGCRDSHLQILKDHVNDEKPFCILEDDVDFIGDLDKLSVCMADLPADWDCLYLGGSPQQEQEIYSENLYRIRKTWCTHAIIWNPLGGAIDQIMRYEFGVNKIDVFLANFIQPYYNCFMTRPLLATQAQTESDTCGKSDVSTIITNYNQYCK